MILPKYNDFLLPIPKTTPKTIHDETPDYGCNDIKDVNELYAKIKQGNLERQNQEFMKADELRKMHQKASMMQNLKDFASEFVTFDF